MAKTKTASKAKNRSSSRLQSDSIFIFKLVLFLILGSQWLYLVNGRAQLPLPIGAVIGLGFILKEPNMADRKIEYALLLVSMFVGFWLPMGITIAS